MSFLGVAEPPSFRVILVCATHLDSVDALARALVQGANTRPRPALIRRIWRRLAVARARPRARSSSKSEPQPLDPAAPPSAGPPGSPQSPASSPAPPTPPDALAQFWAVPSSSLLALAPPTLPAAASPGSASAPCRDEVAPAETRRPLGDALASVVRNAAAANEELMEEGRRIGGACSAAHVPSLHFIGVHDDFKPQSEQWVEAFHPHDRMVVYVDAGHDLPLGTAKAVSGELHDFFSHGKPSWMARVPQGHAAAPSLPRALQVFGRRSRADPSVALALRTLPVAPTRPHSSATELRFDPQGLSIIQTRLVGQGLMCTVQQALEMQDGDAVVMHDHDVTKPPVKYGELLRFIRTAGDLRRLGCCTPDTVVGYPVPPGAAGAVALLTVMAQCTAAPLDPSASAADVADAIVQLRIARMLVFEGVPAPAAVSAAAQAAIPVHTLCLDPETTGLWRAPAEAAAAPAKPLVNSGTGLLLRTSGTTSRPKVVPLDVAPLVHNGYTLGRSLGLTRHDVCINVMPLFHIGGISGSVLAVLATGGATLFAPPFAPEAFVPLLAAAGARRPTWYSSVPTIHMAAYNYARTLGAAGAAPAHGLRFIRSGAAALSHADACALRDFWGVPVIPTYSMSELMPIAQPREGYRLQYPDAVGQPVCASLAVVDASLRPVPFETDGEVCIAGPTVMRGYRDNPAANRKAFFYLGPDRYFRTGDVGRLNREGYLSLTGRAKELIKRGGEQVGPAEVDAVLDRHPAVQKAVTFAVPSALWGEEVGAAVVLRDGVPEGPAAEAEMAKSIKDFARGCGLAPYKVPAHVRFAAAGSLPMTATKKYIRVGLHARFGVEGAAVPPPPALPLAYSPCVSGLRYILSCAVMFNHIGSAAPVAGLNGWGPVANMQSDFPVSVFFALGGFSLAASLPAEIKDKGDFYRAKVSALYPPYLLALLLCVANLLAVCRPDTFDPAFSWRDGPAGDARCAATLVEMPWVATFGSTLAVYALGLQAWFFALPFSWFLMYYSWYMSVYFFCVGVYPWFHNWLHRLRRRPRALWAAALGVVAAMWLRCGVFAFNFLTESGFGAAEASDLSNGFVLSAYLCPLTWLPLFLGGAVACAFYDRLRPTQTHSRAAWGLVADLLSLVFLAYAVVDATGVTNAFLVGEPSSGINGTLPQRFWSAFLTSSYVPLILPWIIGLASGQGLTARLLGAETLTKYCAPAAYNVFLLHQPISQYYYWATRLTDWDWWSHRKSFYWFSPYPLPVPWWEYGGGPHDLRGVRHGAARGRPADEPLGAPAGPGLRLPAQRRHPPRPGRPSGPVRLDGLGGDPGHAAVGHRAAEHRHAGAGGGVERHPQAAGRQSEGPRGVSDGGRPRLTGGAADFRRSAERAERGRERVVIAAPTFSASPHFWGRWIQRRGQFREGRLSRGGISPLRKVAEFPSRRSFRGV